MTVSILCGCASSDRSSLGRLQVGDAGATCSFLTTTFGGPDIGRGRNEGHLKSAGEVTSLFGPFGIKARRIHWRLAALGMGLEEYHVLTYAPPALSLYEDTLVTAKSVRDRQLVPREDVQAYYRRLFSGNFLNTDVLIASFEYGGIGIEEVREQFWRWLGYTYDDYRLDYYLFNGNRNMISKLYSRGIITKKEATYLLARWFLERTTYEPSMLDDLEYFQIISQEDAALLTKLELAYLGHFNFEPAERRKLIEQHATVYNAVRTTAKWPFTIPRLSKIKAIAPSLRNRYADAYDPKTYIAIKPLVIPQPIGKYKGYDPRIAVSINDGRKLSTSERLSRWYVGNIFSAFGAARGDTQTAYEFKRRLHSPASKFLVELVASARNKGVVTADQHAEYITACVRGGYCNRWIYLAAKEYNMPVLPDVASNTRFLGKCFVQGIEYDDYRVITTLAAGDYYDTVSDLLRYRISNFETSGNVITIVCAEEAGLIGRRESDALLVAHFYLLLEQLTDPSWVASRLEPGWRIRAQRSEVERAQYEYKANRAIKEVENVRSPHN
ncbi:MAG: hypothetical protein HOP33_21165 [Verrucomicrobia bacterium]|nr:hypothetical protein [Verrucomicrobiota bacterium]